MSVKDEYLEHRRHAMWVKLIFLCAICELIRTHSPMLGYAIAAGLLVCWIRHLCYR